MAVREKPGKKGSIISISALLCCLNVRDSQGNKNPLENVFTVSQAARRAGPLRSLWCNTPQHCPFAERVALK